MRLGELLAYFETSPALRLLRAQNAPFVVDFLDRQFKRAGRISIPHSDLLAALVAYQEELQDIHPEKLSGKADVYLTEWSSSRWLQRFLEPSRDEPMYQLTSHAEEVFAFLDRVLEPVAKRSAEELRAERSWFHGASAGHPDHARAPLRRKGLRHQATV